MDKISEEESSNTDKLRISSSDRGAEYQHHMKNQHEAKREKRQRVSQTERIEEK